MAVQRLHRSRDIRAVFAARNAAHGRLLSLHGRANEQGESLRVAVIGGREIGNAVRRNRAKRRVRAAARLTDLPMGMDLVIRAKAPAVDADFAALRSELSRLACRVASRRPSRDAARAAQAQAGPRPGAAADASGGAR